MLCVGLSGATNVIRGALVLFSTLLVQFNLGILYVMQSLDSARDNRLGNQVQVRNY